MIISHTHEFVIATPTKTGALSLKNWASRIERDSGSDELLTTDNHKHRMNVPDGLEDYQRFILVRDPYDRMVSMYYYLREKHWEWEHLRITGMTFYRFLEFILEQRNGRSQFYKNMGVRPVMWTASLEQCSEFLSRNGEMNDPMTASTVTPLRIESVNHDIEKATGITWPDRVKHNHKTASRDRDLGDMWRLCDDKTRALWDELCAGDSRFGYQPITERRW